MCSSYKVHLLIVCCMASFCIVVGRFSKRRADAYAATKNVSLSPQDVEIAYDMHDVLIQCGKVDITCRVISEAGADCFRVGWGIISDSVQNFFTGRKGRYVQLLDELKSLKRSGAGASDYARVLDAYEPGLGNAVLRIMRAYKPIVGMTELLSEVDACGYIQRLATNEGQAFVADQLLQNPALFQYLDGGMTGDTYRKPDEQYFVEYQKTYGQGKKIIFIDDRLANVESARKAGMIGIHFTSVSHLRKTLRKLGIPVRLKGICKVRHPHKKILQ